MKIILNLLIITLFSNIALADGFICHTTDGSLDVKIFNEVMPTSGTKNGAVMVISDPNVSLGRKTIAVFSADEGNLKNSGSKYYARVDERFNNIPKGEYLAGTRLDYLKSIVVDVNFSYSSPLFNGADVEGWLILVKENTTQIKSKLICSRYLKN